MNVLLASNFFPSISYMHVFLHAEKVCIHTTEPYRKQTYRNRTTLLTSQGMYALSVPIEKKGQKQMLTSKISYAEDWQKNHLKTIISAYGKAPFFEHYFPYLESFFSKKHTHLIHLNEESLNLCLKFLNPNSTPETNATPDNTYLDLSDVISPKKESILSSENTYYQMFGENFTKDLSILDLLFCEGPNALHFLKNQCRVALKKTKL